MSKKYSNTQNKYLKISQQIKQLAFKYNQRKAAADELSNFYHTVALPANKQYDQLHLELLDCLYNFHQKMAPDLTLVEQNKLNRIIEKYYKLASPVGLMDLPIGTKVHQLLYDESLDEYYEDDLDFLREDAKDMLERESILYNPEFLNVASNLLELQNCCMEAIIQEYNEMFEQMAPDLKDRHRLKDLKMLDKWIHPYTIERLIIKINRIGMRLGKIIELLPIAKLLIQPHFPWVLTEEEAEEQAFYLEEAARFYETLDLDNMILLCLDWLEYMQEPLKKLPDSTLKSYLESLQAFRDHISAALAMDSFKYGESFDAMAVEYFCYIHNINELKHDHKIRLEDIREAKNLCGLFITVLEAERQKSPATNQQSQVKSALESDALQQILVWINGKISDWDEEFEEEDDEEEDDEQFRS